MEIYISTGGFRSETASEVVAKFIQNGIKNIELSGTKYASENIAEISKLKDKVKLQIHNYFPPPKLPFVLNLASSDDKIYKKSFEHINNALETCAKLNCKYYSFHAGFLCDIQVKELGKKILNRDLQERNDCISVFIERVSKISKKAKKLGINLMIENNVLTQNTEKEFKQNPFLMCEKDECLKVINKLPENVRLLVDVAHLKISSKTLNFAPEGFLKSCNNIIGGYHLSDNNGLSDTNEKFTEDSWFWPYINKKINYYTIEVYDLDFKEIKNLYNLTKKKLND